MSPEPTHRRSLVKAALAGGVAVGAVGVAVRLDPGSAPDDPTRGPSLELSADAGSDVKSLEVPLDDAMLSRSSRGQWSTNDLPTSVHSMVALTWLGESTAELSVRSKVAGRWSGWTTLPTLDDHPDPTDEVSSVRGTHLRWVGAAEGVQVRVSGSRPDGLTLVLLHPAHRPGDDAVLASPDPGLSLYARGMPAAPRPEIRSRKDWGATESWRDGSPRYESTVQQVHVHHTVTGNDYARGDVAGLIRGMYRYHTQNLGWSDIGYNFLVDRFGRIYEGRAGGVAKVVRGAHTLGFNDDSAGVAAIGNFEIAAPSNDLLTGIAEVAAWKLSTYGLPARGKTSVRSTGSDRYGAGRVVTLPYIDGHRDTNYTACPGGLLYAKLPKIRKKAQRIIRGVGQQPAVRAVQEPTVSGTARPRRRLVLDRGSYEPDDATTSVQWRRAGTAVAGATGRRYMCGQKDLGQEMSVVVKAQSASASAIERVVVAGVVTTPVKLVVNARAMPSNKGSRQSVQVDVTARSQQGLDVVPTGTVTISLGKLGKRSQVVKLSKGKASARFGRSNGLNVGTKLIEVRYVGDRSVDPGAESTTVQVTNGRS